jgi:hypothetical protein
MTTPYGPTSVYLRRRHRDLTIDHGSQTHRSYRHCVAWIVGTAIGLAVVVAVIVRAVAKLSLAWWLASGGAMLVLTLVIAGLVVASILGNRLRVVA